MTAPLLETHDLVKDYVIGGEVLHAVNGVSLTIKRGEFVAIMGASGSGKSTFMNMIGCLDIPTSGTLLLDGIDTKTLDSDALAEIRNRKIGFVFQSFNLIDELSVFDNIALPLRYRRNKVSDSDIEEKVIECLQTVDMTHRAQHKPNQLSGGQQQRIAIARALVGSPALLLVDEPTGNLDSKNGDAVMDMLRQLNSAGTTICMVTHDPRYADMATRKLHLLDGKMVDTQAQLKVAV